jgi:spore coat polysaccharide biosynthesis protein SpsF
MMSEKSVSSINGEKPNVVAIIQGRMSSSRLPGKILLEIGGQPMLVQVVERVQKAQRVNRVVVATTTDPSDDPVEHLCKKHSYACYRGSQFDVLDRFYQAARIQDADVVVRVTADCPLIDPQVIDRTIQAFFDHNADFAANRLPPPWKRSFPIGLDTEVCSFQALEHAWKEAVLPYEREHVMPYLYEEEGRFRVVTIDAEQDWGHLRWTVDTAEDLETVRSLFTLFGKREVLSWLDVLSIWQAHPELEMINAQVRHHNFDDFDERFTK